MRDIMMIFPISGDGACLYNAVAAYLYGDQKQSSHLRKMAHEFIVQHWWYWKQYIILPFTETVGVGSASYIVNKETEQEFFDFLRSDESLLMWSTHTDIAVLANMCNLTVHTFTYNVPNQPPRWFPTPPDPYLTYYTTVDTSPPSDVALYNYNNCHYDLLVTPDSRLALLGSVSVSSHLSVVPEEESVIDTVTEEEGGVITLEEGVASPCLRRAMPHLQDAPSVSPLIFLPCPKGPGRPKTGRQGAACMKRKKDDDNSSEQAPKKRRGRPPGAKNKQKPITESEDMRKRAEYSASVENTLPFFDSGDVCNICDFALNDPIKALTKIIQCPRCNEYIHEPCLVKSGCACTF